MDPRRSAVVQLLKIEKESMQRDGVAYIKLTGIIDARTFELLDEKLQEQFARGQFKIMLDMNGIHYIVSSGVGTFVGAQGHARAHGGLIVLVGVQTAIREVLDSVGVSSLLPMVADRSDGYPLFAELFCPAAPKSPVPSATPTIQSSATMSAVRRTSSFKTPESLPAITVPAAPASPPPDRKSFGGFKF